MACPSSLTYGLNRVEEKVCGLGTQDVQARGVVDGDASDDSPTVMVSNLRMDLGIGMVRHMKGPRVRRNPHAQTKACVCGFQDF